MNVKEQAPGLASGGGEGQRTLFSIVETHYGVNVQVAPSQIEEGEHRKESVLAVLEANRKGLVLRGRAALLRVLMATGEANIQDVRAALQLPEAGCPKWLGAVPGGLARAGIIAPAGFCKTSRPRAHARFLTRWQLADPEAARSWLAAHPEAGGIAHG
mgnify:CR=1 FL=1